MIYYVFKMRMAKHRSPISPDLREKYGLSQSDFYQRFAYGQNYLNADHPLQIHLKEIDSCGPAVGKNFQVEPQFQ